MRDSKNVHTVRFPKAGEGPQNKTTGNVDNASNGVGTGSETIVDPTQSFRDTNPDGSEVVSSGATVLTHELLGHGGDADNGQLQDTGDPAGDAKANHVSAVAVENEFKDAMGEKRRELE